jgi:hypothetical protein
LAEEYRDPVAAVDRNRGQARYEVVGFNSAADRESSPGTDGFPNVTRMTLTVDDGDHLAAAAASQQYGFPGWAASTSRGEEAG